MLLVESSSRRAAPRRVSCRVAAPRRGHVVVWAAPRYAAQVSDTRPKLLYETQESKSDSCADTKVENGPL